MHFVACAWTPHLMTSEPRRIIRATVGVGYAVMTTLTDYDRESPETRARLDHACRPIEDGEVIRPLDFDELFGDL